MKTKRMRLTSKTVCRMHRLARELEALNGVRVNSYSFIVEGRRAFLFAIRALDPKDDWQLIQCGYAFNIRDALANFYRDMGDLLYCRDAARKERRWRNFLVDAAPARFTAGALRCWGPGIHGRQVVLSA